VEIVQGKTLDSVSVVIDETMFIDCTMIDCILEYSGGPVSFERTNMRGCRYVFFGQARATIHFLQEVGLMDHHPSEWGEFPTLVH
jgi:hypothetical protein